LLYQTAWGVARCALELARAGKLVSAAAMAPSYHRLSQAERERLGRAE
ncbi:MAG: tRNA (adenosine(37)-N6)-threonylcarbamoyltransferase complex dimerization subunit type 1 TsaB, partial [Oscillospiraceae bacterium]|nr:tRNA (adenosine(37)-N6)-threonylcarbamoyltransferase complex dimerization subunit type 1 TsaB [Oscillospiraceae bacterium]